MLTAGRNQIGLTERQIEYCLEAWAVLCADRPVELDTSEARQHSSRTRFNEDQNKVFLGSDAPAWRRSRRDFPHVNARFFGA
jgi:hypothetical protein